MFLISGADADGAGGGADAVALGLGRTIGAGGTTLGAEEATTAGPDTRAAVASGVWAHAAGAGGVAGRGDVTRGRVSSTAAHAPAAARVAANASPKAHFRSSLRGRGEAEARSIASTVRSAKSAGGSCAGHCFQSCRVIYSSRTPSSMARIRSRARNSRVFTVFSGTPSVRAISAIPSSWNSASTNTAR